MTIWVDDNTTADWDAQANQVVIYVDGVEVERRAPTTEDMQRKVAYDQELAIQAAAVAAAAHRETVMSARALLKAALDVVTFQPLSTPEEQAIVDAQIDDAIVAFRAITDPPSDLAAIAARLLAWKVQ